MLVVFCFLALHNSAIFAQNDEQTMHEIAEAQLVAYNKGDVEEFMKVFHDDISIWNYGDTVPRVEGFKNVKSIYKDLFESSPNLNSEVINRSVIGNKILDYEYITGRRGSKEATFLIMIYEIKDGKIFKATAIRD